MTKIVANATDKGGTGKTTALVNVASQLAIDGYNILVADYDIENPNFGACFKGIITNTENRITRTKVSGLDLILVNNFKSLPPSEIKKIKDEGKYHAILLDTPPSSAFSMPFLAIADEIYLVTGLNPSEMTAVKNTIRDVLSYRFKAKTNEYLTDLFEKLKNEKSDDPYLQVLENIRAKPIEERPMYIKDQIAECDNKELRKLLMKQEQSLLHDERLDGYIEGFKAKNAGKEEKEKTIKELLDAINDELESNKNDLKKMYEFIEFGGNTKAKDGIKEQFENVLKESKFGIIFNRILPSQYAANCERMMDFVLKLDPKMNVDKMGSKEVLESRINAFGAGYLCESNLISYASKGNEKDRIWPIPLPLHTINPCPGYGKKSPIYEKAMDSLKNGTIMKNIKDLANVYQSDKSCGKLPEAEEYLSKESLSDLKYRKGN